MTKRKSLSKKIRFEVFKRDSFTCQYCGIKSPDVVLHVDHIQPVSKGGSDDLLNLITSCQPCNSGKSDRELNDTAVIDKQRDQLEQLQERQEQLEMMFEWQKGLLSLDQDAIDNLSEFWSELVSGYFLNETGIQDLRKLYKNFSVCEIMNAMTTATDSYLEWNDNGDLIVESVNIAYRKMGGICKCKQMDKENPGYSRLLYIRGILRNRLNYCDEERAIQILREAYHSGISIQELEEDAKHSSSWTNWRSEIENKINNSL